ncbi:unnamed protein product [Symbiodinium natans]|uniref:Lysine 2,3-aminomutase n=1 Tax=Symbiodinium natans TaxID=878477 RepID=A0A812RWJ6_9DINO|nr:unnamed protein product [Symbiodinium natans]
MVMPSGTQVHADAWWMNSYQRGEDTVTEYLVTMWRPMGNLPDWEIEYNQMRSRWEATTISDGDPTDIFVWPISASFFEADPGPGILRWLALLAASLLTIKDGAGAFSLVPRLWSTVAWQEALLLALFFEEIGKRAGKSTLGRSISGPVLEDVVVAAPAVDAWELLALWGRAGDCVENFLIKLIDASTGEKKLKLSQRLQDIKLAALVFPFRCSSYVMEHLINWNADDLDSDPMYRLLFPTLQMLSQKHQQQLLDARALEDPFALEEAVKAIRSDLNPQPAGQLTLNRPKTDELKGIQHKYAETCLLFPAAGQTCHAYCTYCFRWAQFIGDDSVQLKQKDAEAFLKYLGEHPELTDVLITGGDPFIMRVSLLKTYLHKFADPTFLPHIQNLRFGTRFTTDPDAAELLDFIQQLIEVGGRSVDIMAHLSHDVELSTPHAEKSVRVLQAAGATIRSQSPIMKGINDDADVWAKKWKLGRMKREVQLGIIPYYMPLGPESSFLVNRQFLARDTGAQDYFSIPLARAHQIYADAIRQSSGLARTARGPSMSCTPGKVEITGVEMVNGQKAFVMRFLQCRDPAWIGRVFFAKYSETAIWFDELPASFTLAAVVFLVEVC